jgi:hypothetical protein
LPGLVIAVSDRGRESVSVSNAAPELRELAPQSVQTIRNAESPGAAR